MSVGRYHLAENQWGNAFMAGPNKTGEYVKHEDYAKMADEASGLFECLEMCANEVGQTLIRGKEGYNFNAPMFINDCIRSAIANAKEARNA